MDINNDLKEKFINELKEEILTELKKELKEDILKAIFETKTERIPYKSYNKKCVDYGFKYKVEDITFATRSDAEKTLNDMKEILEKYGCVCVADLYDLTNLRSNYEDNKYGWTNLDDVVIYHEKNGKYYGLLLPQAKRLEEE